MVLRGDGQAPPLCPKPPEPHCSPPAALDRTPGAAEATRAPSGTAVRRPFLPMEPRLPADPAGPPPGRGHTTHPSIQWGGGGHVPLSSQHRIWDVRCAGQARSTQTRDTWRKCYRDPGQAARRRVSRSTLEEATGGRASGAFPRENKTAEKREVREGQDEPRLTQKHNGHNVEPDTSCGFTFPKTCA